jgi:hypothetical protein
MKCDKLKAFDVIINDDYKTKCYTKADVDAAIAELKAQLRKLKRALWLARSRRAFAEARYNNQIARRYEDRNEKTIAECYDKEVAKWKNSDRKCRAKAEQYK